MGTVCALTTAGCGVDVPFIGGPDPVLEARGESVDLDVTAPAYATQRGRRTVVVVGGEQRTYDDRAVTGWLPGDRVLRRTDGERLEILSPDGTVTTLSTDAVGDQPSRSVTQVNLLQRFDDPASLEAWTVDGTPVEVPALPEIDDPEATADNGGVRNYYGAVPTVAGVTFAKWHDSSEYFDGQYGVARIEGEEVTNVLVDGGVDGMYLSSDGAALVLLVDPEGNTSSGGQREQELVEIDPATGDLAEYGVPDGYNSSWRVQAIDKVGDRVAVQYRSTTDYETVLRGTWVYDGDWSLLEGSEEELTWWQGDDRVVARPVALDREPLLWDLTWVHDGTEEPLVDGVSLETTSVPGSLLPPG
ncbi:MAG: hypothetical protein CMH83_11970 [Nocardioides sp.]|nr:hypothetical protein [Nocardioides sp.]